ncbi:hypothetical protein Pyn_18221 [Prunus yedoensis var. nudiflora]|uniref:Uncharacterized protein n=1 Tax=Prunus yedoensis var. nudiflora TaxID=2094558 RepID=A0A314Y196_PRUYE|nr:hypothetical protein Pyn_18221 [Prunus yedoensis var. nudiflora]
MVLRYKHDCPTTRVCKFFLHQTKSGRRWEVVDCLNTWRTSRRCFSEALERRRLPRISILISLLGLVRRRRVLPSYKARDHRRREGPYQRQVDALKERMLLDVSGSALRPEPALRVLVEEPGNEVTRVTFERAGGRGVGNARGFFTMLRSVFSFDGAANGVWP